MSPLTRYCGTPRLLFAALLVLMCAIFGALPISCAGGLPSPELGASMIERLRDVKTRQQAMVELHLAVSRVKPADRPYISLYIRDPRLTRCPSPQGVLWLASYVPAYDDWFRARDHATAPEAYPLVPGDPANIASGAAPGFGDLTTEGEKDGLWSPPAAPLKERVLRFLDGKGKVISPFGGDSMTGSGGWITDLTQDGILDRAGSTNYGHPKEEERRVTTITAFWIATVEPKPRKLLEVLYNWHPRDADADNRWDWDLPDLDGDGLREVCLGPKVHGTVEPKAVYHWNGTTHTFDGPAGGPGQHFLRQTDPGGGGWGWIEQVAAEGGLKYPLHESPPSGPPQPEVKEPPPPTPQPFQPHSLASLPDEKLAAFFLSSRHQELQRFLSPIPKCALPGELWSLPPRDAALLLVEANRTAEHRGRFVLLTAPEVPATAGPDTGMVQTGSEPGVSPPCGEWLSVGAKEASLLALPGPCWVDRLSGEKEGGALIRRGPYGIANKGYQAQSIPLERARWILQTLWWLDQVRTKQTRRLSDGKQRSALLGLNDPESSRDTDVRNRCALWITPGDGRPAVVHPIEYLWQLGAGWRGHYTRKHAHALSTRLWYAWLQREATAQLEEVPVPAMLLSSLEGGELGSPLFPALWVRAMAQEAGNRGLQEARPSLEKLLAKLPPPSALEQEWTYLNPSSPGLEMQRKQVDWCETNRIERAVFREPAFHLRGTVSEALRKIDVFRDEAALMMIAAADSKDEPLRRWAEDRLHRISPAELTPSQIAAMPAERRAEMLLDLKRWEEAKALFATLDAAGRARMVAPLCKRLPKGHDWPPTAFEDLLTAVRNGGKLGFPEGGAEAMDLLVPAEEPLRFPDARIEEAAREMTCDWGLPGAALAGVDRTLFRASAMLALTRRHADFASLEIVLRNWHDQFSRRGFRINESEAALAHLANVGVAGAGQSLEQKLRERFAATHGRWSAISLLAWTVNLRGLEPDLPRVATQDENEEEPSVASALRSIESPVGRHHAARWVVALWREPDSLARAKALVCLAAQPGWRADLPGLRGPGWRLEQEFRPALASLDAKQRAELTRFAEALPELHLARMDASDAQLAQARDWALGQLEPATTK